MEEYLSTLPMQRNHLNTNVKPKIGMIPPHESSEGKFLHLNTKVKLRLQ